MDNNKSTITFAASTPVFMVMDGQSYLGVTVNGQPTMVLYTTHADAGQVALAMPTAHVREIKYADILNFCKAMGVPVSLVLDGRLYDVVSIHRDYTAEELLRNDRPLVA